MITPRCLLLIVWCVLPSISGCLAPHSLEKAVIDYDQAITNSLAKQLLINIARSHHHQTVHFTGIENIAATFDFRFSAGATPPLGGIEGGWALAPIFGGSVAENPTISIAPIDGEMFTKRLLTPLQESKLTLLLRQGVDIGLLLRLMAGELRIVQEDREIPYYNKTSDQVGYSIFRRAVLHLSKLQDDHHLYVEPLILERHWTVPFSGLSGEDFVTLEKEFQVAYDAQAQTYHLRKRDVGRIVITNYDPDLLSPAERLELQQQAKHWPPNDLLVDIRPGFPGGEFPIHGDFRLRSFHAILNFLGRTLEEEPEYHVEPDSRTGPVGLNPIQTFSLTESEFPPPEALVVAAYDEKYYSFHDEGEESWNKEAFRLLYQLFQMTVTEPLKGVAPSITIAK